MLSTNPVELGKPRQQPGIPVSTGRERLGTQHPADLIDYRRHMRTGVGVHPAGNRPGDLRHP